MSFDILNRWTKALMYHSEDCSELGPTVIQAIAKRAYLQGAYLRGAYLRGAYLQGADLQGAYLQGAYLRGAYLRGAYLRGADLQGADLRGADLRGAEGITAKVLQIGGSRDWIVVRQIGHITIGCEHHPLIWWEEHYAAVGRREKYTDQEIAEYRAHIATCRAWMELYGLLEIPASVEAAS